MNPYLRSVLTMCASLFVLLLAWDVSVVHLQVPTYLLPRPKDVGLALWSGYIKDGHYWVHMFTTLSEMVIGYLIGCSMAFIAGAAVAEWRLLERILMPYVVALQSMPKVALAPLLIVWFGFGITSKIVLVALICFFPVFINCFYGFQSANPDLLKLYRSLNASRLHVFLHLKLPSAAGPLFAGLQISVVLALIGAVVGEFVSSKQGLGYLIQSSTLNFDVATMFAAVITLSLLGISVSSLIRWLHRKLVFWDQRSTGNASVLTEGG
ncbi:MAG: ABC transporter permease [Lacisediminimonas sp.]|nr:ABC transporter permease [Lacisediminimonas sp.]